MDPSRKPTPRTARRIALAVFIAAHACVAALLPARLPSSAVEGAAKARPRNVLTVHLHIEHAPATSALPAHAMPAAAPTHPPAPASARGSGQASVRASVPVPVPVPAQVQARAPARVVAQAMTAGPSAPVAPAGLDHLQHLQHLQHPQHQQHAIDEAPAALPAPAPPPPDPPAAAAAAAVPGAAFAGLFSPVTSRPLGRSGWGTRRDAAPDVSPSAEVQREQALLALRMAVLGRLGELTERLRASGHALDCRVAIDASRRVADVQCADPADQGAAWIAMQGLVQAGSVQPHGASLCFFIAGAHVATPECTAAEATTAKGDAAFAASP